MSRVSATYIQISLRHLLTDVQVRLAPEGYAIYFLSFFLYTSIKGVLVGMILRNFFFGPGKPMTVVGLIIMVNFIEDDPTSVPLF